MLGVLLQYIVVSFCSHFFTNAGSLLQLALLHRLDDPSRMCASLYLLHSTKHMLVFLCSLIFALLKVLLILFRFNSIEFNTCYFHIFIFHLGLCLSMCVMKHSLLCTADLMHADNDPEAAVLRLGYVSFGI